jgi:hypothetical protein
MSISILHQLQGVEREISIRERAKQQRLCSRNVKINVEFTSLHGSDLKQRQHLFVRELRGRHVREVCTNMKNKKIEPEKKTMLEAPRGSW